MRQSTLPASPQRQHKRAGSALRLTVFTVLIIVTWCWQNHRLTWSSWSVPLNDTGDSLQYLARIKAASEGDLIPFAPHLVHRLAAPFVADWSQFPASDDIANYFVGIAARLVGVMAASNLALLAAHLAAAWTFYLCARLLRQHWEWAAAGALLFCFSYFGTQRGLPHLWLGITFTVPLALLSAWVVAAGRQTVVRSPWRWLCLATAVALGASDPYKLYLYLQLLAWALIFAWFREGWSANLRLGLACAAVAVGVCAAVNSHVLFTGDLGGGPSLLVRNYAATEVYGLKPIELFLPPSDHHGTWLAAFGYRYLRWTNWRGETFSPYLGVMGGAGLVWLLIAFARGVAKRKRLQQSGYALTAIWVLLFSVIGGINSILAFYFGLDVFRASNRYSIFLLALSLLFLGSRMTRITRAWRPGFRLGFASLIGAIGLLDQLPVRMSTQAEKSIAEQVQSDRALGDRLERILGAGAMIFQLPVLDFPEERPVLGVNEYDPLRLYDATNTLRFSYGELKERARGAWQQDCKRMEPAALVAALESYGFSALYIDRRGYPDHAKKLVAGVAAAGRSDILTGTSPDACVVLLKNQSRRALPLAGEFTYGDGWNRLTEAERSRLSVALASAGAEGPLPIPRWTNGSASLYYFNPQSMPLRARLDLVVDSAGSRTISIQLNGTELARRHLDGKPVAFAVESLSLRPGNNCLKLDSPEPPIRVSQERLSLRAIGAYKIEMQLESGQKVSLPEDPGGNR